MTNQLLNMACKCRANDPCLFEGQDMFVDISITNAQDTEVGFPLEYVQRSGPIVRLIDTRTKAVTSLKPNLADPDLKKNIVRIHPGGSVNVEWVITSDEIQQFEGPYVDLSAEFTVMAEVQVRGKPVAFRGSTTLRIVSGKR